jgi:hypothetical protein
VLYREAETGKRLISSAQAIGIFDDVEDNRGGSIKRFGGC